MHRGRDETNPRNVTEILSIATGSLPGYFFKPKFCTMKLKQFTPENCTAGGRQSDSNPLLKMKKTGNVIFNKPAIALMGLKVGVHVILVQDEDDPENWYITAVNEGGWELRLVKDTDQLTFQAAGLTRTVFASLGIDTDKQVKFKLAGQPTKDGKQLYWGILTNTASWEGKKL